MHTGSLTLFKQAKNYIETIRHGLSQHTICASSISQDVPLNYIISVSGRLNFETKQVFTFTFSCEHFHTITFKKMYPYVKN